MRKSMEKYRGLSEITVTSQRELDDIPEDFAGTICINSGNEFNSLSIKKRYLRPVEVSKSFTVSARNNSEVVARDNSTVVAFDDCVIEAHDNSTVNAWGRSAVTALNKSSVTVYDHCGVVAHGRSNVVARGDSAVNAWGRSEVIALDRSTVEAYDYSLVEARGCGVVTAWGNSQVIDCSEEARISISGNARIVHEPKDIKEYCSFYGIKPSNGKVKLYKAARKRNDKYFSNYFSRLDSGIEYMIGQTLTTDKSNTDPNAVFCDCQFYLYCKCSAMGFWLTCKDYAVIECEADIVNIELPFAGSNSVCADKATVVRKVPLEECGILGGILAGRKKAVIKK